MRNILIDLTISEFELKAIASDLKISFDYLIRNRDEENIEKMYIDMDTFKIFLYTLKGSDELHFTDGSREVFKSIETYRINTDALYDTDVILEKIAEVTYEFLSDGEKAHLKTLKK